MTAHALTDEERAELRDVLARAIEDVVRSRAASADDARPVDLQLSIGRLSRVDALQQQQMALARRQRSDERLRQLRAALERVDTPSFGTCIECEEPIGLARLRARPETLLCRACQPGGRP